VDVSKGVGSLGANRSVFQVKKRVLNSIRFFFWDNLNFMVENEDCSRVMNGMLLHLYSTEEAQHVLLP
jgi:hypothetical protein